MQDATLTDWEPDQLAARCRESRSDNSHERFCLALFHCAIARRNERCWALLYAQYQKLVLRWTLDTLQIGSPPLEQTPEEFVVEAFATFWRAYRADKLASAEGVASVLSYLKSCAVTTVLQAQRRAQKRTLQTEWDEQLLEQKGAAAPTQPEQRLLTASYATQLWQLVDANCHDEAERIVARLSFVANLKPNVILERHPDRFSDVAQIYAIRRNLKNRLSRNEALRALWKEGAE